jgi:hypothetical protein
MNYLELVNEATKEAGVELDALTQANFASPPGSKMYSRFKTWISDTWRELQTKGKESYFSSAVVVTSLRPRVRVYNLAATTTVIGKQYYNATDDVISVIAEGPSVSGDKLLGSYTGFLDIGADTDFSVLELGSDWIEDTLDINPNSFKVGGFVGYSIAELDSTLQALTSKPIILRIEGQDFTVQFVEWKSWMNELKGEYGTPRLYTTSPDGYLYFYPNLGFDTTLLAYGNQKPQTLFAYSDVPTRLPESQHRAIVLGAVMKYANYERDSRLWSTANREFGEYSTMINRDAGMIPRFQDSQYG